MPKKKLVEMPAPVAITESVAPVREPRDPAKVVGLDRSRDGCYDYVEAARSPYGRDRTIVVDGARYDHVADDVDGVWLYRHSPL